ncbi:hypothetical protein BJY01DRAFT_230036 [Aspergillus pseudoustus]|uniref:Uncharacterized protein n=1 Tax=Aspergillus pseudoustus TaxID=1810923 RepID=A0ABR4IDP4_9EURO
MSLTLQQSDLRVLDCKRLASDPLRIYYHGMLLLLFFFNEDVRCFEFRTLALDVAKLPDCSKFVFPIVGIVANPGQSIVQNLQRQS